MTPKENKEWWADVVGFIVAVITGIVLFVLISMLANDAHAGKPPPKPEAIAKQAQGQYQGQGQAQKQSSYQGQALNNELAVSSEVAATGSAVNEGNEQNISVSHEARAPDVVMIPNNNTEQCLRIWGLSFVNQNGGGGLGIPTRSRECDLEAAADDAAAHGLLELAWTFKCKQKALKKAFGGPEWRTRGEGRCLDVARESLQAKSLLREQEQTIGVLRDRLAILQNQQAVDREDCERSKDRIIEGCRK